MLKWLALLLLTVAHAQVICDNPPTCAPASGGAPAALEEFAGPLLGWTRAQADLGCPVNGSDASTCLNNALASMPGSYSVLYLEPGTYTINNTLNFMTGSMRRQGINVIGADPATTIIKWGGSAGGTMATIGNSGTADMSYSKIARLTFDGNSSASIIWDESVGSGFDTTNYYPDIVFKNAAIGLRCGEGGIGCADLDFPRATFQNLTSYGASTQNWNALDVDFYYSTFNNVTIAGRTDLSGGGGYGNLSFFGDLFENNTTSDLSLYSPQMTPILGNFSTGSAKFITNGNGNLTDELGSLIVNNTIVNVTGASPTINFPVTGGLTFVGNTIQSANGASAPAVQVAPGGGDLMSLGNTFTVGTPAATCGSSAPVNAARCHESSVAGQLPDQVVARGSINTTPPTMPATPPNNGPGGNNTRQIYEVGTCASFEGSNCHSNASIGAAVTAAISGGSSRPIVHIPVGTYTGVGITVPACPNAGCDMQIIGDGWNTNVEGSGSVVTLTGPSQAVVKEINLTGGTDGILLTNADQSGARVYIDQAAFLSTTTNGLWMDSLVNTTVEAHDLLPSGSPTNGNGILSNGGTLNVFGGSASCTWNLVNTSGAANVFFYGVWNDACNGGTAQECTMLLATGSGNITYATAATYLYAPSSGCTPNSVMNFNNFTGNGLLQGLNFQSCGTVNANCTMTDTGAAGGSNVLIEANVGPANNSNYFSDTATGTHKSAFLNDWECNGTTDSFGFCQVTSHSSADEYCNPSSPCPDFGMLASAVTQAKNAQMVYPSALAAGITNVQLYRIFTQNGVTNGIHVQH